MTTGDILKESWLSISGNKIRSFLTVLGIIIGVMAVVIMVAVGETVQTEINDQFSSLGSNTIMIRSGSAKTNAVHSGASIPTLTFSDAEIIKKLPDVTDITPIEMTGGQIVYKNKNWSTTLIGSYPDYQSIFSIETTHGTFFNDSAVRNASTYAIIGPETAKELGMPEDPVGEVIRIKNVPFVIIGKAKAKGESMMGNQDDRIIIPVTTLKKRLSGTRFPNAVTYMSARINQNSDNAILTSQITALLRNNHKLKNGDDNNFEIMDMKQVMETMSTITGYMKLLLIAIASISLLVGSIGIMNMMLVSVVERTREIGIRKAIGAREKHIIIQFLSESIMISFIGSMLGLMLGVGLSQGIGRFVMGYNVPLSFWPVILSVSVAVIVGLISGVMPAIKAAKLNPIDSLRSE